MTRRRHPRGQVAVERHCGRLRSFAHGPSDGQTLAPIREAADHLNPAGVGPFLAVDSTKLFAIDDVDAWIRHRPGQSDTTQHGT